MSQERIQRAPSDHLVTNVEQLRSLYRRPTEAVATKKVDHVAPWGDAWITTEPDLLERFAEGGRRPKTVIGVRVRELFLHCSAAFKRSQLWSPTSWRDDGDRPYQDFVIEELRRTMPPAELPEWAR